jgi:ABC-2 type transport system ATP-binding protein
VIRALELSKSFAGTRALERVSFEARSGEVLGLLGPNGAGKTTAMRIVTGFLPASDGRVEVCGLDVAQKPRAARACIGYLPESAPLYPEMRVDEYLRYRAALKGVRARERAARLDEATALVGIGDVRRRVIGQLSKGYRQRVGLADALLARPAVLILDEPTDGLDPNQRREVLALIARLGAERTVVLSTHILPEVESVCARVVILDRGRVIAEGRPAELAHGSKRLRVVARGDAAAIRAAVERVEGVRAVQAGTEAQAEAEAGTIVMLIECERDARERVARAVLAAGELRELRAAAAGLDEIFARLTGAERA